MTRYRATLIHFGLSVLVVGSVFLAVYFLWYPQPLFRGAGGRDLFITLALVDITIGPLLTLIVFKPGKRGLKFDLATIAVMQVAALAYGTHVAFEARPVWLVFIKDRFDLVRANQVLPADRAKARPEYRELSLTGPRIVGARLPDDPVERFHLAMTAASGFDVSSFPQHYVPYDQVRREVLAKSKPLEELRRINPADVPEIDRMLAAMGRKDTEVAFLPLRAGKRDLTVFLDPKSGEVLKLAPFEPWLY